MSSTRSKEFVIPVENQSGQLADLTTVLAKADVNITGLFCEGRGEFGVVRMVTDRPDVTEATLRAARTLFRMNDVVSVRVPNRPGALAVLAERLAAGGVNVNAAYASSNDEGEAQLTFSVDDLRSAVKILH